MPPATNSFRRGAPPGKGGGGRGVGGRGGGGNHDAQPRTREDRKESRRNKQAEAVAAREKAEDDYFHQCQAAALKSGEASKVKAGVVNGKEADEREKLLFAQQGSQGIQFNKYKDIKVQLSGPGTNSAKALDRFASLDKLPPFLARNIQLMHYATPTPIQQHAVPLALAGSDLMCCAQTGSGKTAAFLIPVCTALSGETAGKSTVGVPGAARPRAVVMAPTRELASQIELEAQKLTNRSVLRPVAVYGGADQRAQAKALALGCDVIVATPGRLNDFVERRIVELRQTHFLVLDEADRMLDMGFEPQIRKIVRAMPPTAERQTLLFSATFPPTIQQLAKEFLRPYVWIGVGRVGSTVDGIEQRIWLAQPDKRKKLEQVVLALSEVRRAFSRRIAPSLCYRWCPPTCFP